MAVKSKGAIRRWPALPKLLIPLGQGIADFPASKFTYYDAASLTLCQEIFWVPDSTSDYSSWSFPLYFLTDKIALLLTCSLQLPLQLNLPDENKLGMG